jgi:hypothetical protein
MVFEREYAAPSVFLRLQTRDSETVFGAGGASEVFAVPQFLPSFEVFLRASEEACQSNLLF